MHVIVVTCCFVVVGEVSMVQIMGMKIESSSTTTGTLTASNGTPATQILRQKAHARHVWTFSLTESAWRHRFVYVSPFVLA